MDHTRIGFSTSLARVFFSFVCARAQNVGWSDDVMDARNPGFLNPRQYLLMLMCKMWHTTDEHLHVHLVFYLFNIVSFINVRFFTMNFVSSRPTITHQVFFAAFESNTVQYPKRYQENSMFT